MLRRQLECSCEIEIRLKRIMKYKGKVDLCHQYLEKFFDNKSVHVSSSMFIFCLGAFYALLRWLSY